MRQVGIIAAAGIYGLDNNLPLLKDDTQRAKSLGNAIKTLKDNDMFQIGPIDTNIVISKLMKNTN